MKCNRFSFVAALAAVFALASATQASVISGTAGSRDSWNVAGNWSAGVPTGGADAVIADNLLAQVNNNATPSYSGGLTLGNNSRLQIGWNNTPGSANALGTGSITMTAGSQIISRALGNYTFNQPISLAGDATIWAGISTSDHHRTKTFSGGISGGGQLTYNGVNNTTFLFDTSNALWTGGFATNDPQNQGHRARATSDGAFGTGHVTINNNATLEIASGLTDVIDDSATLSLNGTKDGRRTAKLTLDSSDTVGAFWLDGVNQGYGTFSAATHPGVIGGSGVLTVPLPPGDDIDGDGFNAPADWNDGDPTIYPGAPELPDLKDNNQDSVVDDGLTPTNTMTSDGGGNISWLLGSNWSLDHMPGANDSAVVSDGLTAQVTDLPASFDYEGTLTLNENATLRINDSGGATNLDALSKGGIKMLDGSKISLPTSADPRFPDIELLGDATIDNPTNAAHHDQRYFDGEISGPGSLTLVGTNNNTFFLEETNTFSGGLIANMSGGDWRLEANAAGSLGAGDVTINSDISLVINAANAMADTATLYLNGNPDSRRTYKLIMNASDSILALFIDGAEFDPGEYDNSFDWLDGDGVLTVLGQLDPEVIPEPTTLLIWSLLAGLSVGLRWRRRR